MQPTHDELLTKLVYLIVAENSTLIAVSAFSGLVGAILTQTLTGVFAYVSDKRKFKNELNAQYRGKQIEVAENFYFITGETMTILKKNIEYWKDRNKARSESSIAFFNREIKKLDVYLEKINTDNWKHNLIGLYFNVSLSYSELVEANSKSHLLYLGLLDLADKIKVAVPEDKDKLLGKYHTGIFDLCTQYENIYIMLEKDLNSVKQELLLTFQVNS